MSTPPAARLPTGFVGLGVVLLVLLAGGALVALATDPFVTSRQTICPEDSVRMAIEEGAAETVCLVSNLERDEFGFGVTIRNEGRLPARVRSVPLVQLDAGGFLPTEVRSAPPPDQEVVDPANFDHFEPFTLASGEERLLWIAGQLEPCEARETGRSTTVSRLIFRMSRLGLPREAEITFDPGLRWVVEPC